MATPDILGAKSFENLVLQYKYWNEKVLVG